MPVRPHVPPRATGQRAARVVGAAGLVLAFAPMASAQATPATRSSDAAQTPTPDPSGTAARAHTAAVAPDYGDAKFRVGVQIKTGAYVPAGTTTAGSTITITETGPAVGAPLVSTCVTDATTQNGGITYCSSFDDARQADRRAALRKRAAAAGRLTAKVRAQLAANPAQYIAGPGDTVTLTQTGVADPALVLDPATQTVAPCVVATGGLPFCFDPDVIFTDNGVGPAAVDDTAVSTHDAAVDVDVLANDKTYGAPATITSVGTPAHGRVRINPPAAGATTPTLTYTPDAGFHGRDAFTYVVSTANGTSTGHVTITVTAPVATTTASATPSTSTTAPPTTTTVTSSSVAATSSRTVVTSTTTSLAYTGSPVRSDAELGFGLVGVGALLTTFGIRRRPRGMHAG